mgnify:CR=1 FL=1
MSSEKEMEEILQDELDDIKNVQDDSEATDESGSGLLFTISSFGVDHTVESLVKKIEREQYYIPVFQRKYVWSQNDASKFIESLLLGLPVPGIFLYKEQDSQRHLVIDGQQRLKSLEKFYKGLFNDRKFKLTGLKTDWDGKTYDELDEDDQMRLDDAVVHATIFKQDTPTDNMDSVYEVFERINTGGMKLSPQEIRTCVAHGDFNTLLFELNDDSNWRSIFGKKSVRLKDVELILRFFTFYNERQKYSRPMKNFLTNYMTKHKDIAPKDADEIKRVWARLNDVTVRALGPKPFRPGGRALNAAFYDSFSVALAIALETSANEDLEAVRAAYAAIEKDTEYLDVISSSTSLEDNVTKRFDKALQAFSDAAPS